MPAGGRGGHGQATSPLTKESQMPGTPPTDPPPAAPDGAAGPRNPIGLGRVNSIPEVLDRLDAIQRFSEAESRLKDQDGVASFNYLYRIITNRVLELTGTGFFSDDEFLTRLDVAFANRYFNALRAFDANTGPTPRSWKVLFERRGIDRITPMQFAVAGVNAHVNFDLSCAVVETCEELGREPDAGTQHDAYGKVNDIFAQEMEKLRQHFEGRLALWIDEKVLLHVDDLLGNWTVKASRAHAWNLAMLLWKLRTHKAAEELALDVQDRASGLAGHLLLRPL